jgi:hypothetical protein
MSNYTKLTDFASKDSLSTGNAAKIVKGQEIDDEFEAIETAVGTKADLASPTFTGTPAAPTASTTTNTTQVATTAFVRQEINAIPAVDLSTVFPVGSIYMNATNSTNPATLLGFGTWVAFGAGRVPIGIDSSDTDFDTAEETGGSKTHALTEAEMPKHFHALRGPSGPFASNQQSGSTTGSGNFGGGTPDDASVAYSTESVGGGAASGSASQGSSNGNAHTIVQPYIVVYMWKRTA